MSAYFHLLRGTLALFTLKQKNHFVIQMNLLADEPSRMFRIAASMLVYLHKTAPSVRHNG